MDKRFLGILAFIVVIFIAIFGFSKHSSNSSSGSTSKTQATNHVTGQGKKNVTFMEYGDYQCPVCESYYLPVKEAVDQLSPDIHFQFRNLPLVQIHPNAFAAARAAEAASLQNKYWQMHDILYDQTNWQAWTTSRDPVSFFNTYAQQLGLNVNQFKTDYSSSKVNDVINADLEAFRQTGQEMATPAFFIDGKFINNTEVSDSNGPSADKIVSLINAEIAKKNP
jgi:protein-disulfide isomerase